MKLYCKLVWPVFPATNSENIFWYCIYIRTLTWYLWECCLVSVLLLWPVWWVHWTDQEVASVSHQCGQGQVPGDHGTSVSCDLGQVHGDHGTSVSGWTWPGPPPGWWSSGPAAGAGGGCGCCGWWWCLHFSQNLHHVHLLHPFKKYVVLDQ